VYTGCAILVAFVAPWPVLSAGLFVLTTALAVLARVPGAYLRLMRGAVLVLFLALFTVQSLFYPGRQTPLFGLGPLTVWVEGVAFALETAARLLAIVSSMGLLVLTTRPADLVAGLEERGVSHRFGYTVLLTLQIVPEMQRRVRTILDAQRARAVETEGHLLVRARAFLPVLGPLVTSSLMGIETRALALEARGFSAPGRRTRVHPLTDSRWQAAGRRLMAVAAGAILLYRVILWALRFVA
jgi:energy-coupling factor transporter transmembrane protein EcfT